MVSVSVVAQGCSPRQRLSGHPNQAYDAFILNTSDPTVMKRAIDMTDDELRAITSGCQAYSHQVSATWQRHG